MTDVTQQHIIAGIRSLGVGPGDLLLAHTSLKSFGRVEGGAKAVAEALIQSVAPGGTVLVPTFNYGMLPYDPATTESLTGAVTDALWRLPGAVRSGHPTHAFAGVGPLAPELLEGHPDAHPLGRGSPLWRLWKRDAWVLLMGCDHRANSIIHVAEESMNVPYLGRTRLARLLRGNQVAEVAVGRPGCSNGFNALDEPLRCAGYVRQTTVGRSRFMLMRACEIITVASRMLASDPAALLCHLPDCERCTWARERILERTRSA
ncbi:MAG TPA: AAC(3) family N-acetyltransferase [Tepidisphaeraceae bacterium]|nr:AAC(3) family N-acetyltransferase [Tepidisphaeraceae bacterium]